MKVLITGGAGYIGSEVVKLLCLQVGIEEVIVYDNLCRNNYNLFINDQIFNTKIKFIKGDILDSRRLQEVMKNGVNVVCHLAARVTTPFASLDAHLFEQVNNWGTADVVYSAENSSVSKFIYLSSTSIYGGTTSRDSLIDEKTSPNPKTFYGISKLRGEEHVNRLKPKMNTYILRCGNVYGFSPSMRFDAVINKFMFEANYYNQITINGTGNQNRAFIHINDIVQTICKIVVTEEVEAETYNIAGKNLSINMICEQLQSIYPSLETLYVNYHVSLRELKLNLESNLLLKKISNRQLDLKTELLDFQKNFSFSSL